MVAARRSGLTPPPPPTAAPAAGGPWWDIDDNDDDDDWGREGCCWGWGCGVLVPVAIGVVKLEGSSEVKIVALEGEMR